MGAYYVYLISSLPMLSFVSRMPFTPDEFIAKCEGLIPEQESGILKGIIQAGPSSLSAAAKGVLGEWGKFEIILRNELARARAGRKKSDFSRFVRLPDNFDARISHVAMAAYRSASILEGEKILDQARWDFLESLSFGHYFDFDFLIVYALKLKILERWSRIQDADKEQLFNRMVVN